MPLPNTAVRKKAGEKIRNLNLRKRLPRATAEGRELSGTAETVPPKGADFRNPPDVFRQKENIFGEFRNRFVQRNVFSGASEDKMPEGMYCGKMMRENQDVQLYDLILFI